MRDLTYPPIIVAAKTGFRVLGQKFDIVGHEHVPRSGGVLLACNHIGYVDFVYGGLAANPSGRKVRFMAKRELFDHTLTGPLMRSLHHIEVDRGEGLASFHTAVDYLKAGEAVGIFPEATISRALELKEFKTGAVRIAAEAGVPLVPVIMWGTQRMMTKDHPRDFSRGKTILLRVGAPMHPTGADPVAETAELHRVMSQLLDDAITSLPRGRAAARLVVAAEAVRRLGADPRGGRRHGRRGEGPAGRPQGPVDRATNCYIDYRFVDISEFPQVRAYRPPDVRAKRALRAKRARLAIGLGGHDDGEAASAASVVVGRGRSSLGYARVHDVDDPAQVVEAGELDGDLALGPAEVDLDPGLEPVREPVGELGQAGRGRLGARGLLRGSGSPSTPTATISSRPRTLMPSATTRWASRSCRSGSSTASSDRAWPADSTPAATRRWTAGESLSSRIVLEICGRDRPIRAASSSWVHSKSSSSWA